MRATGVGVVGVDFEKEAKRAVVSEGAVEVGHKVQTILMLHLSSLLPGNAR